MSETTEIKLGENKSNESKIVKNLKKVFGFDSDEGIITGVCLTQGSIVKLLNENLNMDVTPQQVNGKLHGKYSYRDYKKEYDNGKTKEFSDDEDKKFRPQVYFQSVKTNSSQYPLWEINVDNPEVQEKIEEVGESTIDNTKDFLEFIESLQ